MRTASAPTARAALARPSHYTATQKANLLQSQRLVPATTSWTVSVGGGLAVPGLSLEADTFTASIGPDPSSGDAALTINTTTNGVIVPPLPVPAASLTFSPPAAGYYMIDCLVGAAGGSFRLVTRSTGDEVTTSAASQHVTALYVAPGATTERFVLTGNAPSWSISSCEVSAVQPVS